MEIPIKMDALGVPPFSETLSLRLVMLIIPNHIVGFETYFIVKMGSSSPTFGVNIQKYLSCHHPDSHCIFLFF